MKPMVSSVTSRVVIFILPFLWEQASGASAKSSAHTHDVSLLQSDSAFHETNLAQRDVSGNGLGIRRLSPG
jgi:hypothetical protein